eukprot:TRINITY_DN87901_c0_g1_i1.p1 TRINITY_DN87901_c0_g1~~TRINITY_DN87901_c0_g1_i1.p1  ORF type:complete len:301 (-),score=49.52 TRINITY_DN87901_c0_g1_i1:244-1146(-)
MKRHSHIEHILAVKSVGLAGVSNAISAAATNPVDVLKVRMQMAGIGISAQRMGIKQSAMIILAEEGVRGFYRGIVPSILRELFYSGIRMGLYEPAKKTIGGNGPTSLVAKVMAGAITGATGSIIANPLDLIKVRMQSVSGTHPPYSSVLAGIRDICQEGGSVRSLWRGAVPTVQRAALLTAAQVPSYDHMKHFMLDSNYMHDDYTCHFVCCMGAGVLAAAVTSPVDLAKSRIMAQPVDRASGKGLLYQNTFHCLRCIAQAEGPLALFKGFNGQWLRIGPHTTISLMAFEQLRRLSGMQPL